MIMATSKPILFNSDMVRALLDGRKTQTRRVVKPQPTRNSGTEYWAWGGDPEAESLDIADIKNMIVKASPYNADYLWVRETFARSGVDFDEQPFEVEGPVYRTDAVNPNPKWIPSIHMPRWASRLTLKITDIRVERLQYISEADAKAEGAKRGTLKIEDQLLVGQGSHRVGFANLWQSINGKTYPWDSNPWVWVVEFEVINQNIDLGS